MWPAVFASCVGIMDSALIRLNMAWTCCFSAAGFSRASQSNKDEHQPFITVVNTDCVEVESSVNSPLSGVLCVECSLKKWSAL
ncbi:hypothetical protein ACOMHN_054740 [Nucella lapillus]